MCDLRFTGGKFEAQIRQVTNELKAFLLSLSRVHKSEESLLTSTSGFDNYRGLVNLCLILLVRETILVDSSKIMFPLKINILQN